DGRAPGPGGPSSAAARAPGGRGRRGRPHASGTAGRGRGDQRLQPRRPVAADRRRPSYFSRGTGGAGTEAGGRRVPASPSGGTGGGHRRAGPVGAHGAGSLKD